MNRHREYERLSDLPMRIAYYSFYHVGYRDDLVQEGCIALWNATGSYDPTQGAALETYAGIRIRGAMQDYVRLMGPSSVMRVSRSVMRKFYSKESGRVIAAKEHELGRSLKMSEKAALIGWSRSDEEAAGRVKYVLRDQQEVKHGERGKDGMFSVFSWDLVESKAFSAPDADGFDDGDTDGFVEFLQELAKGSGGILRGQEREVFELLLSNIDLDEGDRWTLQTIGDVMGVSESRISQIASSVHRRINRMMQ